MPVPIVSFLIVLFQFFCFGSHPITTRAVHTPIVQAQHQIAFHNIADQETPRYTFDFEEGEDTEDDSNELLKNILATFVSRRAFSRVAKHEYSFVSGACFFFEQTSLFLLHRNFRV